MVSPFPTRIVFRQTALELLRHEAEAAYPREACGVLIGLREITSLQVELTVAGANLSADPLAFELDPACLVEAEREAAARGLAILGFWHSHADAPAILSEKDRLGAWPHALQVVVPVSGAGMGLPRFYRGLDADWSEVLEFEIAAG
ncbi:MAG: M67 family metallopeptidase [Planctomycetota bacterium]